MDSNTIVVSLYYPRVTLITQSDLKNTSSTVSLAGAIGTDLKGGPKR